MEHSYVECEGKIAAARFSYETPFFAAPKGDKCRAEATIALQPSTHSARAGAKHRFSMHGRTLSLLHLPLECSLEKGGERNRHEASVQ